jgi:nucleotide-binding universal stress UspA family protein
LSSKDILYKIIPPAAGRLRVRAGAGDKAATGDKAGAGDTAGAGDKAGSGDGGMFKCVLLCYDGSDAGRRALRRGAELAIQLNAHAHVLLILPGGVEEPYLVAGATGHACIVDDATLHYREMLAKSVKWLEARGVTAEAHMSRGNVIEQIAAHTKRLDIDLIVLGHYPRPAGGFWWTGSQRTSLAERANCCVFVAVDTPEDRAVAAYGSPTG